MSEEKKQEKHKPRTISCIALVVGVIAFVSGLMIVTYALFGAFVSSSDVIESFLRDAVKFANLSFWFSFYIGLILSIVTLLFERNKYYRLLPLAFVLVGIGLYAVSIYIIMVS